MFCPIRGWCSIILFEYDKKLTHIQLYCNSTWLFRKCTTFISEIDIVKASIPKQCICNECYNVICFRNLVSGAKEKFRGAYKECLCLECTYDYLCFPVMVAPGEEDDYIKSLSDKGFQRLLLGINSFLKQAVFEGRITESLASFTRAVDRRTY